MIDFPPNGMTPFMYAISPGMPEEAALSSDLWRAVLREDGLPLVGVDPPDGALAA